MKVTHARLLSESREILEFALTTVPSDDKFFMRSSFGLDPDQVFPRYSGKGLSSGKKWNHFSRKKREVSLRIVLNPNYLLSESYSDIRDDLYRSISMNRSGQLDLIFYNGGSAVMQLSGFITKFEVPYSSETPELQITMEFEDPMFKSVGSIYYPTAQIATGNEIIVSAGDATAPLGFTFQVTFDAVCDDFVIQDKLSDPDLVFSVTPDDGFGIGDTLYFSSVYRDKNLYMIDAGDPGVRIPLLDHIDQGSVWPILFPGMNEFYLPSPSDYTWDFISFYKLYWGL
ncbi:hypothetical protein KC887_02250 [Candidatus Kaiserbacteria bacterium]|nr:hypothetical protein [Candidatus Kaiserbacteria bacterium]